MKLPDKDETTRTLSGNDVGELFQLRDEEAVDLEFVRIEAARQLEALVEPVALETATETKVNFPS